MSEPGTQRRPWWTLHFSTKVVIAIVFLGLVLANVPGQQVLSVNVPDHSSNYGPHFHLYPHYEHGWPAKYLSRGNSNSSTTSWTDCWRLSQRVFDFSPMLMILNLSIAGALIGLATASFEVWRRRRQSLIRFRLGELFGVITIVALGFGWLQYKIRIARGERIALREAADDYRSRNPKNTLGEGIEYEHGGPTFLRELVGNHDPLIAFDSVVSADVADWNPRFADRFPHLKCITPFSEFDEEDARAVAALHELEGLNVLWSSMGNLSDFPPLPKLRGINLCESGATEHDLKWLGKCSNLEQIDLSQVNIGDEGLRYLLGLKKLKSFSAGGGYDRPRFTDECFDLLAQLDSLEELWLSGEFPGDKVEALLDLKQLKSLDLKSPNFSPASLKRLEKFSHLKWLAIRGHGISDADITRLQAALPNCKVGGPGF